MQLSYEFCTFFLNMDQNSSFSNTRLQINYTLISKLNYKKEVFSFVSALLSASCAFLEIRIN